MYIMSVITEAITAGIQTEISFRFPKRNDPANTPQVESVCDKCGGRSYQRNDDNLEAFQTRYAMYLEKTAPIIEHYRKQNVLHVVNGEDTVENVFNNVDEIISKN